MKYHMKIVCIGILFLAVFTASCSQVVDTSVAVSSETESVISSDKTTVVYSLETTETSITTESYLSETTESVVSESSDEANPMPESYKKLILDYCKAAEKVKVWHDPQYTGIFYSRKNTEAIYGKKYRKKAIPISIDDLEGKLSKKSLKNVGYYLEDINSDGLPELIVCEKKSVTTYEYGLRIGSLYTIDQDGHAVKLLGSWSRCNGFLGSDGSILISAQSGHSIMTEHEYNKYIIKDCELVLVDAFYTAYNQYFYIQNKKTWDKFMKKLYNTDIADITGKPYTGGVFKETLSSKKKFNKFVKPYKKKPNMVFTTFDQFRKSIG